MTQLDLFKEEEKMRPLHPREMRIFIAETEPANRKEIRDKLKKKGVIIDSSLTKYCTAVFFGKYTPKHIIEKYEILKYDGYEIPKISIDEFDRLFGSHPRIKSPRVEKKLNVTSDFIKRSRFVAMPKEGSQHPLGQREILVPKNTSWRVKQTLGNIGAYTTIHFEPKTTDFLWLTNETEEKIKNNIQDNYIKYISEVYNKSDAEKFTYQFLRESDFLSFVKRRCLMIGDKVTYDLCRNL